MCYGSNKFPAKSDLIPAVSIDTDAAAAVFDLRDRLIQTEARLARARAREAELSRRLNEMKRFVSVMEIVEAYLSSRFRQHQNDVVRLLSPLSSTC